MDFCSEALGPEILSDKPCIDGHEPNVLALKNSVPFRCEAFIRAPMDIRVEFIVPIDIARIVIGPEVSDRYASGLSVTTHYSNVTGGIHEPRRNSLPGPSSSALHPLKEFLCRAPSLSQLTAKSSSTGAAERGSSQFAGQWFTGQQKLVVLRNRQYKHFLNDAPLPTENKGLHVYEGSLKQQDKFSLRNVHALTLRIIRIVPMGPPALRFLEVWGQPAVGVARGTKAELINSWTAYQAKRKSILGKPPPPLFYTSSPPPEQRLLLQAADVVAADLTVDTEIPEDFLDPLTCELMTIPLLLPSGNSIDAQSLDKFTAHEALWGRKPSDPFTGVPFKPLFSAVANVHLKARIDRFLLLNKIDGCGRTLASSTDELTHHCGRSRLLGKRKPPAQEAPSPLVKKPKWVAGGCVADNPAVGGSASRPSLPASSLLRSNSTRADVRGHGLIKRLHSSFRQTARLPGTRAVRPLSATCELGEWPSVPSAPTPASQTSEAKPLAASNETLLSPRSSSGLSLFRKRVLKCSCSNEGCYGLNCPHTLCPECLTKHRLDDGAVECPECYARTQRSEIFRRHVGSIFVF